MQSPNICCWYELMYRLPRPGDGPDAVHVVDIEQTFDTMYEAT